MASGSLLASTLAIARIGGLALSYLIGTNIFVQSDLAGVPEGYVRDSNPAWYYGSTASAALSLGHTLFPVSLRRKLRPH